MSARTAAAAVTCSYTFGSMSPIFMAAPMALAKPFPSGAGAVMW